VVLAVVALQCTERKRANPLDPLNRETQGRPTGLTVTSEKNTVTLWWDSININALVGYNVYRRDGARRTFEKLTPAPVPTATFTDVTVQFNIEYFYRVSAQTRTFESPMSDSVSIIPGPTFHWVVDVDAGSVVKLTHDARHRVFEVGGLITPVAVAANSTTGAAWVADLTTGEVTRVSRQGEILGNLTGFFSPRAVAVDAKTGALWVADQRQGRVTRADSVGGGAVSLGGFGRPVSLSVNPNDGQCWVADPARRQVSIVGATGQSRRTLPTPFVAPWAVAVDPRDGSAWVADSTQVLKVQPTGEVLTQLRSFTFAKALAVNPQNGECWVLDQVFATRRSRLVKLSATGAPLLQKDGFTLPEGLAVSAYDGSCTVADTENGRIVKLSSAGSLLADFPAFLRPWAVAVELN